MYSQIIVVSSIILYCKLYSSSIITKSQN
uniref:Uncharacterized protein n=1 Tax=Arundo donax TaxID=35708 RepID=A0A0A9FFK7_ARUDO